MVFLALDCLRGMFLLGIKWRAILHLETSAVLRAGSWLLTVESARTEQLKALPQSAWAVDCSLQGKWGQYPLWGAALQRTFLPEDREGISAVSLASLPSALQVSLSGVLSKYWLGWTLLILGNQWDDSPRYCSKKTSKEICIYLWLFSTSINMFPWSNGIVTIL